MWGLSDEKGPGGAPKCTCYKARSCKDQGKHPIDTGNAQITSPQEGVRLVANAIRKCPTLNLAVLTGNSGLLVVDLDQRGDVDGLENFIAMVGDKGFPHAPHQHSGGGGHHFFLQVPIDAKLKTRNFQDGVEFKAGASNINVYPSRHKSGGAYRWDPPPSFELVPPPCPEWILALAARDAASGAKQNQIVTIVREELKKLGKKWSTSSGVDKARNGRSLSALAAFDPQKQATADRVIEVLPDGSRLTILQLAGALAETYSNIKPSCVLEQLKPALDWRVSKGHSTDYAEIEKMLEEAQKKRAVSRGGWRNGLVYAQDGIRLSVGLSNVYLYLRHHPVWDGVIGFDERIGQPVFLKQPPFATTNENYPRPISEDVDVVLIVSWFATDAGGRMSVSKTMVGEALVAAARERYSFDAVREYFEKLEWDGTPRLDTWAIDFAGVADSTYVRRVSACFLLSAVARTYEPGCKADHVVVLEGPQGFMKSTLIRTLSPNPNWVGDTHMRIGDKDAYMQLSGMLFNEDAERSGARKSETELHKNFLTSGTDRYRPPYAKQVVAIPRRGVIVASTNEEFYLTDHTGNRRFWPIRCGNTEGAKISLLREERDQIWAEAVHRYKTPPEDSTYCHEDVPGEIWWLTKAEEELARAEQAERSEVYGHPWLEVVENLMDTPNKFLETAGKMVADMESAFRHVPVREGVVHVADLLKFMEERYTATNAGTLKRVLEVLGWESVREQRAHRRSRGYRAPAWLAARIDIYNANRAGAPSPSVRQVT